MWICPTCERTFKSTNQSHICTTKSIDDILAGKPDNLIMAFDRLLISVIDWEPCTVGASRHAIIFTREKAWLIVKPMSKELDVKFYHREKIEHPLVKKTTFFAKKYAHHIRISDEAQVTTEMLRLLRKGYDS